MRKENTEHSRDIKVAKTVHKGEYGREEKMGRGALTEQAEKDRQQIEQREHEEDKEREME